MEHKIHLTECPRDAMQGMHRFIPTEKKIEYLNALLKAGFNRLDFGSFVSPAAIPQMRDTASLIPHLELQSSTQLLAIVANKRGAEEASAYGEIDFLGFPFSISETFQIRNANASISDSVKRVCAIQELCVKQNKKLLVYISMAFGNPYGDVWSPELAGTYIEMLAKEGIRHFALADTTGVSDSQSITSLFETLLPSFPDLELGAHLHSTPETARQKIEAALRAGCRSFDSALGGYGGCPMASDELTGNLATQTLLRALSESGFTSDVNAEALAPCIRLSEEIAILGS